MSVLFESGHAVDIVLLVLAMESVWLIGMARWRATDVLLRLAPGALMLIALRGSLTGQDWPWIALPLLLSFPVHLVDLARRPRDDRPAAPTAGRLGQSADCR